MQAHAKTFLPSLKPVFQSDAGVMARESEGFPVAYCTLNSKAWHLCDHAVKWGSFIHTSRAQATIQDDGETKRVLFFAFGFWFLA